MLSSLIHKKREYLLLIITFLLLSACAKSELPAGPRGESFSLTDQIHQEDVVRRMREANIPVIVDDEGFVRYLLKDQAKVYSIRRNVLYGEVLRENVYESFVLTSDSVRAQYEVAFKREKIPYKIISENGNLQIEWSQIYSPQVDTIRQSLELDILQEATRQLQQ